MQRTLFIVFLIYLVLLILRPHEFFPGLATTPILQSTMLTAMGIWALMPNKRVEYPQFKLLIPFMIVVWIGMGLAGWWGGIVKAIEKLLPPLLLFVMTSGAVRSVPQLRVVAVFLIALACTLVLHGHLQLRDGVGWTGAIPIQGRITYSGIFNDPNDLGLLIVVAIALSMYLLGYFRSFLIRLVLLGGLGWLCYGVLLTDSRGTMLATLTVFAFYVRQRFGTSAVVIAGIAAIPVLFATTRLAQLDSEEASAEGRLDAWYEGIQLLLQYPLFGVGFSNFVDHHYLTAHNSMVLAMSELGLVGYPLWLAFMGYSAYMLFWLTYRYAPLAKAEGRESTPEIESEIVASRALFAAGLGLALGAFFLSQSYKYMLFMMCGLAVGRYVGAAAVLGPLPGFTLGKDLPRWFGFAILTIIGLWILLKLTL